MPVRYTKINQVLVQHADFYKTWKPERHLQSDLIWVYPLYTYSSKEKTPENIHVMHKLINIGCRFAVFENTNVRTMRGRRILFPMRLKYIHIFRYMVAELPRVFSVIAPVKANVSQSREYQWLNTHVQSYARGPFGFNSNSEKRETDETKERILHNVREME